MDFISYRSSLKAHIPTERPQTFEQGMSSIYCSLLPFCTSTFGFVSFDNQKLLLMDELNLNSNLKLLNAALYSIVLYMIVFDSNRNMTSSCYQLPIVIARINLF